MEWLTCLKQAIDYMEDNLLTIKSPDEVANHVHISSLYLQNGFRVISGYTLGEYMRNRKLYLAAVELSDTDDAVIDIAYKYGYETPASFDKAFVRFHGVTPMDVRKKRGNIKSFMKLNISISVQGGDSMQFRIEKKEKISVVGFERIFDGETSYQEIPKFWDECISKYASHLMKGEAPVGRMEEYVASHHVGEFGVCLDDIENVDSKFNYLVAGYYDGKDIPEGMTVKEIPAGDWAVFECTMATLQETNTKVWKEWMPGNDEYEFTGKYNIEWYSPESEPGPNQKCELWFPVVRK